MLNFKRPWMGCFVFKHTVLTEIIRKNKIYFHSHYTRFQSKHLDILLAINRSPVARCIRLFLFFIQRKLLLELTENTFIRFFAQCKCEFCYLTSTEYNNYHTLLSTHSLKCGMSITHGDAIQNILLGTQSSLKIQENLFRMH